MSCTEQQLRLLIYCTYQERLARHGGKVPGPQGWEDPLVQALCDELAEMSSKRQPLDDDLGQYTQEEQWIGAREGGQMTGWNIRKGQRHAVALGAQKISGRLVFPASAVLEHLGGAA